MRDPEERTRHFVVGKKKEDDFDEPAVRRRNPEKEADEPKDNDEGQEGARKGYFVRRSLREREIEEAQQHRQVIRRARGEDYEEPEDDEEIDDYEEDDYEDERTKAPLLVRIFAWGALLAIFFVCGYLGANHIFNWADKKGGPRVGNVVGSSTELTDTSGQAAGLGDATYRIYFLEGGTFSEREIKIRKGLPEEDIQRLLTVYMDSLKETSALSPGVHVLNIYRSGDWLYVDVTGEFETSLKTLGKDRATAVLTGLVRTMQENFPPIKKVKFYIDGKESKEKAPVDLTSAWELKG